MKLLSVLVLLCCSTMVFCGAIEPLEPFNYDQLQAVADYSGSYRPFGWNQEGTDSMVAPAGVDDRSVWGSAYPFNQPQYPGDMKQAQPMFTETSSNIYQQQQQPQQQEQQYVNEQRFREVPTSVDPSLTINDPTMRTNSESDLASDTTMGLAQATVPLPETPLNNDQPTQLQDIPSENATPEEPRFAADPTPVTSQPATLPASAAIVTPNPATLPTNQPIVPADKLKLPPNMKLPFKKKNKKNKFGLPKNNRKKKWGKKKLYKCIGGGNSCRLNFGGRLKFKTVTVPAGSIAAEDKQQKKQGKSITAPQYSNVPEIAAAQKKLFNSQVEIQKEKKWAKKVRGIMIQYQNKMRRVSRHVLKLQRKIRLQQRRVGELIKNDKRKTLAQELRVAVSALKNLESTSSTLSNKIGTLSKARFNLKGTIARIRRSLGRKLGSLGVSNSDNNNSPLPRFREQLVQKSGSRQLLGNLLTFLQKAQHKTKAHHARLAQKASVDTLADIENKVQQSQLEMQKSRDKHDAEEMESLMTKYGAKRSLH